MIAALKAQLKGLIGEGKIDKSKQLLLLEHDRRTGYKQAEMYRLQAMRN